MGRHHPASDGGNLVSKLPTQFQKNTIGQRTLLENPLGYDNRVSRRGGKEKPL